MISLDISLVWVIINLLVLYLLLKKFLFKPVCKMMDERSAKIQSDLDGAAQAKADAEKIKARELSRAFARRQPDLNRR